MKNQAKNANDFLRDFSWPEENYYIYRIAWYRDTPTNPNYRNGIRYMLGGIMHDVMADYYDGTRYYVDVIAPLFREEDYVELFYNEYGERPFHRPVLTNISFIGNGPFNYYILLY